MVFHLAFYRAVSLSLIVTSKSQRYILFLYNLQVWRRQGHRRTPFFFAWGLTSVLTCYLVFQSLVVSFREVLLWEILLQFTSTAAMLYMLYKTKVVCLSVCLSVCLCVCALHAVQNQGSLSVCLSVSLSVCMCSTRCTKPR